MLKSMHFHNILIKCLVIFPILELGLKPHAFCRNIYDDLNVFQVQTGSREDLMSDYFTRSTRPVPPRDGAKTPTNYVTPTIKTTPPELDGRAPNLDTASNQAFGSRRPPHLLLIRKPFLTEEQDCGPHLYSSPVLAEVWAAAPA